MQLVITALAPIRRDVGDVLAAVRPSGVVALRAEQYQKFLTVSCAAHTLVDHAHQLELPALTFRCRIILCVGHPAGLPLLILLEFRKSEFPADLVIADTQRLNLLVCHVNLFAGFKIDAVDDAVRVDVFAVGVSTDEDFAALEISGKLPCCFVDCARVNVRAFRKALHHVVELDTAVFVVQQLRTQKFVERRFRLAADPADEWLFIPERLIYLRHIPHDTFQAPARLRPCFVVYEMDDCDFGAPPSWSSRRAVLILANSRAAESKFANCTFLIFASTAS